MILSLFIGFVLGAAALLFALQNTQIVALSFMGWQFESSLALLVIAAVTLGFIICLLASLPSAIKSSFKMMGLKKQNKDLVQEIQAQRTAPLIAPDTTVTTVISE